ncbi:MAG: hypothetical protein J6R59_00230 [Paludibacteraceae bacterium]|nr:hypothetical protein [Paludibacteraceae bacterium]
MSVVFGYKILAVSVKMLVGMLYLDEREVREFRDKLDATICRKERKRIWIKFGRKCYENYCIKTFLDKNPI